MGRPDANAYLFDIRKAGRLIGGFIHDRTLSEFLADPMLSSAVERQLEIIGEAVSQMFRAFPETAALLSEGRQIIAFRNFLIHGYASVSHEIVWGIVQGDLPPLLQKVEERLAALES